MSPTHAPDRHPAGRLRPPILVLLILGLVMAGFGWAPPRSEAAVTSQVAPITNPDMPNRCSLNVVISLDLSTSVTDLQVTQLKTQMLALVDSMAGYPVKLAIHTFGTNAPVTNSPNLGLTALDAPGIAALKTKLNDGLTRSGTQRTNWDAAFRAVTSSNNANARYDLMMLVTDGNPTAWNDGNTVRFSSAGGGYDPDLATMNAAVKSANAVKSAGIRIVPVGINDNVTGTQLSDLRAHLRQVSGDQEDLDYYIKQLTNLKKPIVDSLNANCAAITLTKTGVLQADGTIKYTFTLQNTKDLTLTNVGLSDPLLTGPITWGGWPGLPGTLTKGQSVTATARYTPTPAQVSAGSVINVATASGDTATGYTTTATATATVPVAASLTLAKDGSLAPGATGLVGDVVTYTFTARNTGSLPLTAVAISDPMVGLSPLTYGTWASGTTGRLEPGQSISATATYPLKAADVVARQVVNTASVTGTTAGQSKPVATATKTVTFAPAAAINLAKDGTKLANGSLRWTFVVRNVGNVALTNISLSDAMIGDAAPVWGNWPDEEWALAPGEQVSASVEVAPTQAQWDAGTATNTATVTGTPSGMPGTVSHTDSATVPFQDTTRGVSLDKTARVNGDGSVTWTFLVANTGNQSLTNVRVNDPALAGATITWGAWPGGVANTLPGKTSVTGTATRFPSQAERDAGQVINTATATGVPPTGAPLTSTATVTTPLTRTPIISLTKSGALGQQAEGRPGDTVTWTFTIANAGNVTLGEIGLVDERADVQDLTFHWPSADRTLAPGATVRATGTTRLTAAEVDAGRARNTATAAGTSAAGTVTNTHTAELAVTRAPGVDLDKTATLSGGVITYRFTLRNVGNVTLDQIVVSDPMPGLSGISWNEWWPQDGLAAGQEVTGSATYELSTDDLDRTLISNTATVTATTPTETSVGDTATAEVNPVPGPVLTLDKTADVKGAVITYTFTLRNDGNTALVGVELADPMPGLGPITFGRWPGEAGVLLPKQTVTATAGRAITLADRNAGTLSNTAIATATTRRGVRVSGTDTVQVNFVAQPLVELVKTGVLTGSTIDYTFVITNTGNVTLQNLTLNDPMTGLVQGLWPTDALTLDPGRSFTAKASYPTDLADWNRGSVSNTATVNAAGRQGGAVSHSDSEVLALTAAPEVSLKKTGRLVSSTEPGGAPRVPQPADTVAYTFVITNTGNVTLRGIELTDDLPGLSSVAWPQGADTTLDPQESVTLTATRALTARDLDNGAVYNSAAVSGRAPGGATVSDDDATTVLVPRSPTIDLSKQVDLSRPGYAVYTFTVTNPGQVTIGNIALHDDMVGLGEIEWSTWPGTANELAPGQHVVATATLPLTQQHRDGGLLENVATVTGRAVPPPVDPGLPSGVPGNPQPALPVTDTDQVSTNVAQTPALEVHKQGRLVRVDGERRVRWSYTVTNTGNQTLSDVALKDALLNLSPIVFGDWPAAVGTLLPGQSVVATATSPVQRADLERGWVESPVTATAHSPRRAAPLEAIDEFRVPLDGTPSISLAKTGLIAGDRIGYTFVITNTGEVTVTDVGVADEMAGLSTITFGTWPSGEKVLAPGEAVTGTATYDTTEADWQSGEVKNRAEASGSVVRRGVEGSVTVRDEDATRTPLPASASVQLRKSGVQAGAQIDYRFTVRNSGRVTLTGIDLVDELDGLSEVTFENWPGTEGTLAPGEQVEAVATYLPTARDVAAGDVFNRAVVSGQPVTGDRVSDADQVRIPLSPVPGEPEDEADPTPEPDGSASVGPLPDTGAPVRAPLLVGCGLLLLVAGAWTLRRRSRG